MAFVFFETVWGCRSWPRSVTEPAQAETRGAGQDEPIDVHRLVRRLVWGLEVSCRPTVGDRLRLGDQRAVAAIRIAIHDRERPPCCRGRKLARSTPARYQGHSPCCRGRTLVRSYARQAAANQVGGDLQRDSGEASARNSVTSPGLREQDYGTTTRVPIATPP